MSKTLEYAVIFIITFFIGGIIGYICFPYHPGVFFIAGIIFGAFATGAGRLIINLILNR